MLETVMEYLGHRVALMTLLGFMAIDIATGVVLAANRGELNSAISCLGISKKFGMLMLIAMAILLERHLPGVPMGTMICLFYLGVEGLSIVENAGRLGLPMPRGVVESLEKLKSDSESSSRKSRRHVHFESPTVEVKSESAIVRKRDTDQYPTIED